MFLFSFLFAFESILVKRFHLIIGILNRNKHQIDELKQKNEEKLTELNTKLEDCDSALKGHRRELDVCDHSVNRIDCFVEYALLN